MEFAKYENTYEITRADSLGIRTDGDTANNKMEGVFESNMKDSTKEKEEELSVVPLKFRNPYLHFVTVDVISNVLIFIIDCSGQFLPRQHVRAN